MVIDFGEITAAISAAYGAGKGFTDKKVLKQAAADGTVFATQQFSLWADSIAESQIPHFYEYQGESSGQRIDASPGGRLFEFRYNRLPSGLSAYVKTRQAKNPGGPSDTLREAFPGLSGHYFPDKAEHLETTPQLEAVAGVRRYTRRTKAAAPGQPKSLIFERRGEIVFRKRRVWKNEFYGRFEIAFRTYFAQKFITSADTRMQGVAMRLDRTIAGTVAKAAFSARAASMARPPIAGMIVMTDAGRPFMGIRVKQTIAKPAEQVVQKHLKKELKNAWRA